METRASSIQSEEVIDSEPTSAAMVSAPTSPNHLASMMPLAEPGRCRDSSSRMREATSSCQPKTVLSISRRKRSAVRVASP